MLRLWRVAQAADATLTGPKALRRASAASGSGKGLREACDHHVTPGKQAKAACGLPVTSKNLGAFVPGDHDDAYVAVSPESESTQTPSGSAVHSLCTAASVKGSMCQLFGADMTASGFADNRRWGAHLDHFVLWRRS